MRADRNNLTPPPEQQLTDKILVRGSEKYTLLNEDALLVRKLNNFLTSAPPKRENHPLEPRQRHTQTNGSSRDEGFLEASRQHIDMADFEPDFDALVNLDAAGEAFALDEGNFAADGGGFMGLGVGVGFDSNSVNTGGIDWLKGYMDFDSLEPGKGEIGAV